MMNAALKVAPDAHRKRSPERQALADAIVRRAAAEQALTAGQRAATRGLDAVGAAERKVEAARAKVAEAGDQDAARLADAVASGEPVTTMATRAALTKAEDAQHELAAATSAHAKLRARRKDLEDALRDAESCVTGHVYRVIRADAGQLLSEAQQAAARLRELLPVLHFMQAPNLVSPSTPRSSVYTEGFDDEAITSFIANPRSKPDDWYGGPVAQWRAAREALMNDADQPLPALPM
jgi:hypothetical protein